MMYLLVEAFAVVREAAKRKLGMRHFDVQVCYPKSLILVLHMQECKRHCLFLKM